MARADVVSVFEADLDQGDEVVAALADVLSADEAGRAGAFRFDRDRRRYVVGRALLRCLLARHLDRSPRELAFHYASHGKPALPGGPRFNLTHSGPLALVAIGEHELGIDAELLAPEPAGVAERVFSPAELAELRALPPERQDRGFLAGWTRKEAFVKAHGHGLSLPLQDFDVRLDPDGPCALVRTGWDPADAGRWQLADLSTDTYMAALAVAAHGWRPILRPVDPFVILEETTTSLGTP